MTQKFILDPAPTVAWPVTVALPADGGALADWQFTGVFRVYSEADYERLLPRPPVADDGRPVERTRAQVLAENAAALPQFLVGWLDVVHPDGTPVPIAALPDIVTGHPCGLPLSAGLWRAVMEIRYGVAPAKGQGAAPEAVSTAGNSAPPPAAGSSCGVAAQATAAPD
jgi:hypothetical protein